MLAFIPYKWATQDQQGVHIVLWEKVWDLRACTDPDYAERAVWSKYCHCVFVRFKTSPHHLPEHCSAQCCNPVLLWNSRNVLLTTKHHLSFHWHGEECSMSGFSFLSEWFQPSGEEFCAPFSVAAVVGCHCFYLWMKSTKRPFQRCCYTPHPPPGSVTWTSSSFCCGRGAAGGATGPFRERINVIWSQNRMWHL